MNLPRPRCPVMTASPLPVLDSVGNPLGVRIRRLVKGGPRANSDELLVENEPNILGAVAAGIEVLHVLVEEHRALDALSGRLSEALQGVPVTVVRDETLAQLFPETRTPEIFAITRIPRSYRFRSFEGRQGDIVVLDSVAGPGNAGSIIRLCVAFEAAGVVFLDTHHSDIYRRGTVRASAGTIFQLPLVAATTDAFLKFCRASGTTLVATTPHGGSFSDVMATPGRLAFALGSETRGCAPALVAAAGLHCRIPMSPHVESLNVSAAASVLLFCRSRFAAPA
jgi:TrmH family RNA methyltransferase